MLRPQGYGQYIGLPEHMPKGMEREHDTFTCAHCNRVVVVKPMCDPADMGGSCFCCSGLICPSCVGKGCEPFEKKLQQAEMQDVERRRSYGG